MDEYHQLLIATYDGERVGVALGRDLAARARDARERRVHLAFETVETAARDRLAPLVTGAGIESEVLSEREVAAQAAALGDDIGGRGAVAWREILPEFEKFVGHFERLRELAASEDRRACDVLLAHEHASVAMVRALIDGDLGRAEQALRHFLDTV